MRKELIPFRQGTLDSLCGIHAIINALRLLVPDMRKKDAQKLFRVLLKEIARKGALNALWRGMDASLLRHLLRVAVDWIDKDRSVGIKVSRPFAKSRINWSGLIKCLKSNADAGGVALISLHAENWHWTVVRQVTTKTLRLFDSDGIACIRIANCALKKGACHRISASETVLLSRSSGDG